VCACACTCMCIGWGQHWVTSTILHHTKQGLPLNLVATDHLPGLSRHWVQRVCPPPQEWGYRQVQPRPAFWVAIEDLNSDLVLTLRSHAHATSALPTSSSQVWGDIFSRAEDRLLWVMRRQRPFTPAQSERSPRSHSCILCPPPPALLLFLCLQRAGLILRTHLSSWETHVHGKLRKDSNISGHWKQQRKVNIVSVADYSNPAAFDSSWNFWEMLVSSWVCGRSSYLPL
jgi:hypothetical protein